MSNRVYSDEDKEHAIRIWQKRGVTAASREIGCSTQTIYNWVDEAGLRNYQDRESVYQHKKERLNYHLMERVYFLLRMMKSPVEAVATYKESITHYHLDLPSAQDQKNYAIAISILLDRIALREGDPTSRVEAIDANIMDRKLLDLANELADRAKGDDMQELPSETDISQILRDFEDENTGDTSGDSP
ncbi:hypothetical protein [Neptunomonas sp.]|uniref:hypothetical protein n=1 Tax=Neptunomonas sp. TaxID=1971898 RepID=UPI003565EE28